MIHVLNNTLMAPKSLIWLIYFIFLQQVTADLVNHKVIDVFVPEAEANIDRCRTGSYYEIENKRFYELINNRCGSPTVLKNPEEFMPTFLFIEPNANHHLRATASPNEILEAGFDAKRRTIFLVHGFTQSFDSYAAPWLFMAREQYLNNNLHEHYNFFIMDWGKAASGNYFAAAGRVNAMGSFLANFIMKLTENLGSDRMDMHVIGFSLGAHVAGLAGKRIWPKIGRITGIDPAGPCFGSKILQAKDYERLSADDAHLVETWHTDNGLFGGQATQGQFDISINGGGFQPECGDNLKVLFEALITVATKRNKSISPSHTRACLIAVEPVWKNQCQHVAYECSSYISFKLGECGQCDENNSQCYFMGLPFQYQHPMPENNAPMRTTNGKVGKKYFILTGSEGHLCVFHTQILVNLIPIGPNSKFERRVFSFMVELENTDDAKVELIVQNKKSQGVYSHLLLTEGTPERFNRARVKIRDILGVVVPITQLPSQIQDIEINFMSNSDYHQRQALSSRLCPFAVKDDWIEFVECS